MIFVILTAVLAVAVDQVTKYLMAGMLPELPGRTLPVIRDVLHFTYVENEGAAFGMLSEHRWVFMVLSVLGLAAIAVFVAKEKPKSAWVRLAAGLVLGGGVGNMVDRLGFGFAEKKGAVLDFIDCRFVDFYVFNVADACVTVGCFLYMFLLIVSEIRQAREAKQAPAEGEEPAPDAEKEPDGAEPRNEEEAEPDEAGERTEEEGEPEDRDA